MFSLLLEVYFYYFQTHPTTLLKVLEKSCPRADFSFMRANVFVGKPFQYATVVSALQISSDCKFYSSIHFRNSLQNVSTDALSFSPCTASLQIPCPFLNLAANWRRQRMSSLIPVLRTNLWLCVYIGLEIGIPYY